MIQPSHPTPGVYPGGMKTYIHAKTCIKMFMQVHSNSPPWKAQCPAVAEWRVTGHICTIQP